MATIENAGSLQAAIAEASAAGTPDVPGIVELEPGKTYDLKCPNGKRNAPKACGHLLSNVLIRTRAGAEPAVLRMASWAGQKSVHNRTILAAENCANVHVENVVLDGHRLSMADVNDVDYRQGRNGGIFCIYVSDGVRDLLFRGVVARRSLTDGVYIYDYDNTSTDVLFEGCDFDRNRRQGCSIIRFGRRDTPTPQLGFRAVKARRTGDLQGQHGHRPAAGWDIEGNKHDHLVRGLSLYDCIAEDQVGSAFENGRVGPMSVARGFAGDHKGPFEHLIIRNFIAQRNGENFALNVRDQAAWTHIDIDGLTCRNGRLNDRLNIGSSGSDGGTLDGTFRNLDVDGVRIESTLRQTGQRMAFYGVPRSEVTVPPGMREITFDDDPDGTSPDPTPGPQPVIPGEVAKAIQDAGAALVKAGQALLDWGSR